MIDIFICAKCGGPTRIVSLVQDERLARKILSHLCLPSRAPPRGRPWRPCLKQLDIYARHDDFDGTDELPLDS